MQTIQSFTKIAFSIHARTGRRAFSAHPHAEYYKVLLKKFLFQVHPDYFHNLKNIQEINSTNLSVLMNLIDDYIHQTFKTKVDARTLTFYLKPNKEQITPKKVKISLLQLADSISEVLDTVGAEVPEKPANFQARLRSSQPSTSPYGPYGYHNNIIFEDDEAKTVSEFLDSLCERREIVKLREERAYLLHEAEQVCSLRELYYYSTNWNFSSRNSLPSLVYQRLNTGIHGQPIITPSYCIGSLITLRKTRKRFLPSLGMG
jgi:hypothetical protein